MQRAELPSGSLQAIDRVKSTNDMLWFDEFFILAELTIENAFFSRNVAFWRIFWVCQLVTSYKTAEKRVLYGKVGSKRCSSQKYEIVYLLSLFNIAKSKLFVNFVAFSLVYCDPVKLQPTIQIISRPDKYISLNYFADDSEACQTSYSKLQQC